MVRNTAKRRAPGRPAKETPDGALLLIEAARSVFAQEGFEKATLRRIARTAGVDHTLVVHRFGSKESLWQAVVNKEASYIAPFIAEVAQLQKKAEIPIRRRLETALRQMVAGAFGNPECGMLFSSIGSERGEKFDLLLKRVLVPYYDALHPLLQEAAKAGVIRKQHLETLFVALVLTITTAVSRPHIFTYFGNCSGELASVQEHITQLLVVNFLTPQIRSDSGTKGTNRRPTE